MPAMTDPSVLDLPSVVAPAAPVAKDERVLLHMPVDVRSAALGVIAVLGVLFTLRWASAVFIPVMLGLMFSYALSPIVDRLAQWRIPRTLAAALLIGGIVGGLAGTFYSLSDDASALIATLPEAAHKVRNALRPARGQKDGPIDTVQKAAAELQQTADDGAEAKAPRGVTRVQIERPKFVIQDYLWSGGIGLVTFLGQALVVCFITFFLVASGDAFRRKMVKLAGPRISQKKLTVEALDEITEQIQRYLLVQAFTAAVAGVATGLAFQLLGLEHAAVWGVAAMLLSLIPYVGPIALTAAAALVAFLQFGTIQGALGIAGASLVIEGLKGYGLMPWLTSRASRMSPVVVFVGVLAWGWLWGIWGLLLGIPMLMAVKSVCDRIDNLKPIGELLGT